MQCIQYIRYKVVCTNLGMATPIYLLLMYHIIFMNTLLYSTISYLICIFV